MKLREIHISWQVFDTCDIKTENFRDTFSQILRSIKKPDALWFIIDKWYEIITKGDVESLSMSEQITLACIHK